MPTLKKIFIIFSGLIIFFTVTVIAWAGYSVYQCHSFLEGISDFELDTRNGVTFLKSTGLPYSGKAYSSVCGGECGQCGNLHWRGQYKNGKWDGPFDIPLSGLGDAHWFGQGDKTQTYLYRDGKRVQ